MIHFDFDQFLKSLLKTVFLGGNAQKMTISLFSRSNLKFSINFNIKWHPTQYTSPTTKKVQKATKNTKNDFWGKGILRKNANYTQKKISW